MSALTTTGTMQGSSTRFGLSPSPGGQYHQGWYIFLAMMGAMFFGNTPGVGPIIVGVIGVACIYELGMALQGK